MTNPTGPQGVQGPTGHIGDRGARGEQGIQGIQGAQGVQSHADTFVLGKVAGAIEVIASEVSAIRTEMTGMSRQLSDGTVAMAGLGGRLDEIHEQVKRTNGRTTALEKAVAVIERKWAAATYVFRMADKFAEHKIAGLIFAVIASGAAGATLQRFL